MVCLSGEELADLLGPEDDTCRMLLLELQQHQQQQQEQQQQLGNAGQQSSCLSAHLRVKQGGTQAMLELEAGEAAAHQQLQQQLNNVVSRLASSATTSADDVGASASAADGVLVLSQVDNRQCSSCSKGKGAGTEQQL